MFVILRFLSSLFNLVPKRGVALLGTLVGALWFHVVRFRRTVVLENLATAFPALSELDRRRLARRVFDHYGRSFFELLQSIAWSKEDFRRRVNVTGLEHIEKLRAEGKGAFLLSMHSGNWELGVCGLAAGGTPLDVVVKKPRTPWAEKFLGWYRTRTGAGVIFEEGTATDMLRSVAEGRFVCCVLDQFMGPPIGLPVKFFGKPAGTAAGMALFVERKDIPVLPALVHRDERGNPCIRVQPPLTYPPLSAERNERLFERTQVFNDTLEKAIREFPEQWLWLHRRWKPYRGEPRWSSRLVTTATAGLFLFFVGCSTTPGVTPTGIELPPDPKVATPDFKVSDGQEVKPVPAPAPEPAKKESKKKKKTKPAPVVATPPPKPLFEGLPPDRIPFEVGERLEYDINWMALPAGKGITEVRKGDTFNGRPTFHLWGNVLSSKIVDTIYSVDNTVEAIIDASGLIPYKFLVHMLESGQKKETRVAFDHTQGKAFYWSKRLSPKWGNEDVDRQDSFTSTARDMFSGLFAARSLNYTLNQKQTFPVYENGQNMEVEFLPVANEFVNTKVGAFQCWKIKITLKLNNVLKPTGDIHMWLSDDSKKYLVKFDTKVKIGSIYGNLTSLRERL